MAGRTIRRRVILASFSLMLLGTAIGGFLLTQTAYPNLLERAVLIEERLIPESDIWGHSGLLYPLPWFSGSEILWMKAKEFPTHFECFRYNVQHKRENPVVGLNRTIKQQGKSMGHFHSLVLDTVSSDANKFLASPQEMGEVKCFDASGKSGGQFKVSNSVTAGWKASLFFLSDNRTCVGWEDGKVAAIQWEPFSGKPPHFTPKTIPDGAEPFGANRQGIYFASYESPNLFHGLMTEIGLLPFAPNTGYRKLFAVSRTDAVIPYLQLSPDGRRVAWIEDLNAENSPYIPIVSDLLRKVAGDEKPEPTLGTNLAFWIANTDGTKRRCLGRLAMKEVGVLPMAGYWDAPVGILAFTPDGSRLAFYQVTDKSWKIYAINLNEGR